MKLNHKQYLSRIQFKDIPKPNLQTLAQLQNQHLLNIPFENLDIHNNIQIRLDLNRVFTKVVTNKRGGFCYELNGLFHQLLLALGFEAKLITCRVFEKDTGLGKEHAHMAILVKLKDTEYLCDVGFGDFAMRPLALKMGVIQDDPKGEFQIEQFDLKHLQVSKWGLDDSKSKKVLTPEYIFKKTAMHYSDFEEMCHYTQTSPETHFTQKIIITRPTLTGRISLTANSLKITEDGKVEIQEVKNKGEFDDLLFKHFHIRM